MAIAIEILAQKCIAIVIMHYFYYKSIAIVELFAIEIATKFGPNLRIGCGIF